MQKLFIFFLIIFSSAILILSIRGLYGNPSSTDLLSPQWQENGPFELSPERGRFALLYSVVENHSLQFSGELGKFASPDVAIANGHFVSLFAPLLSFITIPGYVIGKIFNLSQVGTFSVIALFAVFNTIFIFLIAKKLGANNVASSIASITFLFATPAYTYSVDLYQHHVSTFLILASIYSLLTIEGPLSVLITFFLCATAIPLDYPNLFFMAPLALYATSTIVNIKNFAKQVNVKIYFYKLVSMLAAVIPLALFLAFNYYSYGSPFQLSGTLPTSKHITNITTATADEITQQVEKVHQEAVQNHTSQNNAVNYFNPRLMLNGFYIQSISPDRGTLIYTPVVLFGIIGFIIAYKKRLRLISLMLAIVGANLLLYAMWTDPWGGWAFGSRYLIPTYAILSIFIAIFLEKIRNNIFILALFLIVFTYSVSVNTLGAITTSANPPQAETLAMEKLSGHEEKYTFMRNLDYLTTGNSKSFVYQKYIQNYMTASEYYLFITLLILAPSWFLLCCLKVGSRKI